MVHVRSTVPQQPRVPPNATDGSSRYTATFGTRLRVSRVAYASLSAGSTTSTGPPNVRTKATRTRRTTRTCRAQSKLEIADPRSDRRPARPAARDSSAIRPGHQKPSGARRCHHDPAKSPFPAFLQLGFTI